MEIKILGTGCARCKTLEKTAIEAVKELGIDARVTKVEDISDIMAYGIMRTPGLVIDEKVVLSGTVPGLTEVKSIISKNL
ncbi:MAG: thioredoxin family protein [Bacteroidota bacterium]